MEEPIVRDAPSSIQNNETLGREERSQSDAKRAYRTLKNKGKAQVRVSKFLPPKNTNDISVNRMDFAPIASLAELGTRNARNLKKNFWGWYTLTVVDINEVGCGIKASPFAGNTYHADVVIPVALDAEDRRDALREYASELADRAKFLTWGDWTNQIS